MTSRRMAACAALATALALMPSSRARAQDPDAASLLRQGVALRREHRNVEALDLFTRALTLSPTPPVRAQVALAEQALGLWIDAERDLDAAIAAADDPWIAKNRSALEEARAVLQKRLAWLTVHVEIPSAQAELDGRPIPSGIETRVLAGSSVLRVRASGYAPAEQNVTLEPGQHVEQTIALAPVPPAAAPPVEASPATAPAPVGDRASPSAAQLARERATRAPSPIGPMALAAAGAIGLGVGAYFGVRAADFKKAQQDACAGCNDEARADWTKAQSSATASTVAFGAGLALAAGGGVWWFLQNRGRGKSSHGIRVAPVLGAAMGVVVGSDL